MIYFSIFLIILIIVLVFVFLVRTRVVSIMSSSLKVGFFTCVILAVSVIVLPFLYVEIADLMLKGTGVYDSIQQWDENSIINTVSDTTSNIITEIQGIFGDKPTSEAVSSSFFETNVYPVLVTSTAVILRISIGVIAAMGMVSCIYLSYATSSVTDMRALQFKYEALEKRILELETPSEA